MNSSSQIPEKERKLYKLMSLWYRNNVKDQLKPSTCRSYLLAIKHVKMYCDDIFVSDIEEEFLQNGLNHLAFSGLAKSTIHKARLVMNNAVLYAVRIKWIKCPPMMKLYIPKIAPTKQVNALTKEEQEAVEAFCRIPENSTYGQVTLFLLNTGIRSSELYNLKWSDFHDSKQSFIEIKKSKTVNGVRCVPLDSVALDIIRNQPKINEYVFLSLNGCKLGQTQMKRHNQLIRDHLGLEEFHNHICRHSFATRALENGVNVNALSKILGHSSVAFTMQRYTTIFNDYLFEQMQLMEK